MAVQHGITPFSGKVGEQVGFRRKRKMFIKKASGSYEVSEESKKSGREFGRGSSASALVRQAFEPLILQGFKADLHNQLSEKFREVIRSGPLLIKGSRGVFDRNSSLLKGFEFSPYARFSKLVSFCPAVTISVDSISVTMPAVEWQKSINAPAKATRAIFSLACGFFDFKNKTSRRSLSGNLVIEKNKPFTGATLNIPVPVCNEQVVLVMMNIFLKR